MRDATGEFLVLTDLPRHSVANALQVQARTDLQAAISAVHFAFSHAQNVISTAASKDKIQEFRDAIASSRLEINAASDKFAADVAAAERLFQAGIDLQQDEEPEPPKEEVPQNV